MLAYEGMKYYKNIRKEKQNENYTEGSRQAIKLPFL